MQNIKKKEINLNRRSLLGFCFSALMSGDFSGSAFRDKQYKRSGQKVVIDRKMPCWSREEGGVHGCQWPLVRVTSTAPTPQIKTQARVTLHPTSATTKTLLVSGQGHSTSWTVRHSLWPPNWTIYIDSWYTLEKIIDMIVNHFLMPATGQCYSIFIIHRRRQRDDDFWTL